MKIISVGFYSYERSCHCKDHLVVLITSLTTGFIKKGMVDVIFGGIRSKTAFIIPANIGLLKNRCHCCQSFCYGEEKVEKRIIRFEDNMWRIRTDVGELPQSERSELIEYFDEIRLPYRLVGDYLCIIGEIDKETVFERMEHFYDGRAEVFPF